MDVVDRNTRSRMMAGIHGRNTKPEVVLRKALHAKGFRYRLHVKGLKGRPDIVMPGRRIAIFVHGCFWHRHPGCFWCSIPSSNIEFWQDKFAANVSRDIAAKDTLISNGWRVATVWECGLRSPYLPETFLSLLRWIESETTQYESEVLRFRPA